jgi:hypothetical protein
MILHPAMTMQQMAQWCAEHKRSITITWTVIGGQVTPLITTQVETPPALSHRTVQAMADKAAAVAP